MSTSDTSTSDLVVRPASNERIAALIAHAGTAFAWFLAPLVVYIVLPRDARWARYHALQSLLWSLLGTLLGLVTFGIAIPIFWAWHMYAAYRTMTRDEYRSEEHTSELQSQSNLV